MITALEMMARQTAEIEAHLSEVVRRLESVERRLTAMLDKPTETQTRRLA